MGKHILVTGGTGFIGQVLCPALLNRGYQLTVLSRQRPEDVRALCGSVTAVSALSDVGEGPGFDGVINLAGEGIAEKRWSDTRKQALRDSRITLTRELVSTLLSCERPPEVVVSGSAVGYYGDQGDQPVTESTAPKPDFAQQLCQDWEQAIEPLSQQGVRVCIARTGLVVGEGGGFLSRMALPFRFGLGGRIGSGKQFMPWVHREDVVAALIWMLETREAQGPYNLVSPNPVSNREFSASLARVLSRPAVFPVPAIILKLAMGEMAGLLLGGQRALPSRLQEEGFQFRWPSLEPALAQAL